MESHQERPTRSNFSPIQKAVILVLFIGACVFLFTYPFNKSQESTTQKIVIGDNSTSKNNFVPPLECVNAFITGIDRKPVEKKAKEWLDGLMQKTSALYKGNSSFFLSIF